MLNKVQEEKYLQKKDLCGLVTENNYVIDSVRMTR